MNLDEAKNEAKEILNRAIMEIDPYAIIGAFSGGDDSLTCIHVVQTLGIKMDAILHVNTRTGINETTQFVRKIGESYDKYIEADAGDAYERRVHNKGFIGRGGRAHAIAYGILKSGPLRHALSKYIRQARRGRRIILINGARRSESSRRKRNMDGPIHQDGKNQNYWVSPLINWQKTHCLNFLDENQIERNPVSQILCRSGECMCGTMQSKESRAEASFFYPEWGIWLDNLEKEVMKNHPWGWGENIPKWATKAKQNQTSSELEFMCTDCVISGKQGGR